MSEILQFLKDLNDIVSELFLLVVMVLGVIWLWKITKI